MAHELDMTLGHAAIAFRGETPWHGLGESIQPDDTLETIQYKAGLEYHVQRTAVQYETAQFIDGDIKSALSKMPDRDVLYRSDTGDALSVVSNRYQIVQPSEILEFYRDLSSDFGFEIEVVGALKGGRKVWALANTNKAFRLKGDEVKGYLLLATSYDGTMATQARFTSVRVVCNNTLTMARAEGKANVTIPHSTAFNANKVKAELDIEGTWHKFGFDMPALVERRVDAKETTQFLLNAYYGLRTPEDVNEYIGEADSKKDKQIISFLDRMQTHLFNSPGANMESARGTLWGVLNAVTHDVDFTTKRSGVDGRLDSAWFGSGENLKNKAFNLALDML